MGIVKWECNTQALDPSRDLAFHRLQPSVDRVSPLVLEMCVKVPADTRALRVAAHFTKLFLTVGGHGLRVRVRV